MTGSSSSTAIYRAGAIVLVAVACLVLARPWAGAQERESPDPAVTVVEVKKKCFKNEIHVTGVLVPSKEIMVNPEKDGFITEVPESVQFGATVKKDDELAHLQEIPMEMPPAAMAGKPPGAVPPGAAPPGAAHPAAVAPEPAPAAGPPKDVILKAPVAGTLTSNRPVVGSLAKKDEVLFQIAEDGKMELLADAPVAILQKIAAKKQASAKITVIGMFDRALNGKVELISGSVNPMTQLGQVHVTIEKEPRLPVGLFGRATISLDERCSPAVPLSAVLFTQEKNHDSDKEVQPVVQVVLRGVVQGKNVGIGLLDATQAEILWGLHEGEMVIAKAGFFRDGDHVRAISPGASK
jgi:multidrug efflux pump subunit AcrA (membrane-fusion protein)